MRSLKKKRRIQVIAIAVVLLVGASGLIGYAMRDGISFFRSPSQIADAPPAAGVVFRVGGLVEEGSLRADGERIAFRVTDGAAAVPVTYTGITPDLFGEGEGVVAMGQMRAGVFEATEILAKHDESYMPREVIEALEEQGVYRAPES